MARRKDLVWDVPDGRITNEQAQLAVLMDIRDELKRMNAVLNCGNFLRVPHTLTGIRANTTSIKRLLSEKVGK
jgi:hypothetical protein